jgi:hypothetical protein
VGGGEERTGEERKDGGEIGKRRRQGEREVGCGGGLITLERVNIRFLCAGEVELRCDTKRALYVSTVASYEWAERTL